MTAFKQIQARAADRKGGAIALAEFLPGEPAVPPLGAMPDDRVLSCMTRRVFCAGFVWRVVEDKWPGFEQAFLGFEPEVLLSQPNEFWDALTSDARIVRNGRKITAVRNNAGFVSEVSEAHGSFGKFLAEWPSSDQVGLLETLAKRGSRLGGNTGQYFLRFVGKDGFILSTDVVTCLQDAGLDVADSPRSKRDLQKVQAQFNAWASESGLPYANMSRICALSVGINHDIGALERYMNHGEAA